jgi:hypothetical protein
VICDNSWTTHHAPRDTNKTCVTHPVRNANECAITGLSKSNASCVSPIPIILWWLGSTETKHRELVAVSYRMHNGKRGFLGWRVPIVLDTLITFPNSIQMLRLPSRSTQSLAKHPTVVPSLPRMGSDLMCSLPCKELKPDIDRMERVKRFRKLWRGSKSRGTYGADVFTMCSVTW